MHFCPQCLRTSWLRPGTGRESVNCAGMVSAAGWLGKEFLGLENETVPNVRTNTLVSTSSLGKSRFVVTVVGVMHQRTSVLFSLQFAAVHRCERRTLPLSWPALSLLPTAGPSCSWDWGWEHSSPWQHNLSGLDSLFLKEKQL